MSYSSNIRSFTTADPQGPSLIHSDYQKIEQQPKAQTGYITEKRAGITAAKSSIPETTIHSPLPLNPLHN